MTDTRQIKIAFFDIDGTLTSEVDRSIPERTKKGIQEARANGHLMFINTGRCFQNVEARFRDIGFDGYVCGCGTNIYCGEQEILSVTQSHETMMDILNIAKATDVDLLFESKMHVCFDLSRPLHDPQAQRMYQAFLRRGYHMPTNLEDPSFVSDKFVIWFQEPAQLEAFRKVSDKYFDCIDRGGNFREFVPTGYSKATGIQRVLDFYQLPLSQSYAFGDSNNDLPMLQYVPNSIAMGNSNPTSLFDQVSYVTDNASQDGIWNALLHFSFIG
ncbi:MAG: HAD hydrolase family protein [Lachnospiraceae bacterium]|nr:HAD hydrolase family protein [Lachnospiraceae bacterium]